MRRLRRDQARRVAVHAAGLHRDRPATVDVRHFRQVVDAINVVQLDSVNVLTRAHEQFFFARLGAYDREKLRLWLWESRELYECWAHVASLVPMEAHPLLRFRQSAIAARGVEQVEEADRAAHQQFMNATRDEVNARGPITISDLSDGGERTEGMWGWSPGKQALWRLHQSGEVGVHQRRVTFVAEYTDVTDVIPAHVRAAPDPTPAEAHEQLVLRAAMGQGFGTDNSLADTYRLGLQEARPAIDALVARGDLVPIEVEGLDRPTWAHRDMVVPRSVAGTRALVNPFDPLIWFRDRVEALWDLHYRIEIYVPEAKRQYGYYVLVFLLDENLVARVDLKADRHAGILRVRSAHAEPGVDHDHVATELAAELHDMAGWLDLEGIDVQQKGDLAPALRRQFSSVSLRATADQDQRDGQDRKDRNRHEQPGPG